MKLIFFHKQDFPVPDQVGFRSLFLIRMSIKHSTLDSKKIQISFSRILRNKQYFAKVLPMRFHLNGNIVGLRPQVKMLWYV